MPSAIAARIAEKPRVALTALKRTLSAPRRAAFESARTQEALMHTISFAQPEVARLVAEHFETLNQTKGESKP